jgi:hypothetical protein
MLKWSTLTTIQKIVVVTFLSVPILSSIISTYHIIALFTLGNPNWVAIVIAIAFEAGAIGSLLALSVLDKMNKGIVYTVFGILLLMQIIGNVYFSFDWVSQMIAANPNWLKTFADLFSWVVGSDPMVAKQFIAYLIGLPIPLLGVLLSKAFVDYVKPTDEQGASTAQPEKASTFDELSSSGPWDARTGYMRAEFPPGSQEPPKVWMDNSSLFQKTTVVADPIDDERQPRMGEEGPDVSQQHEKPWDARYDLGKRVPVPFEHKSDGGTRTYTQEQFKPRVDDTQSEYHNEGGEVQLGQSMVMDLEEENPQWKPMKPAHDPVVDFSVEAKTKKTEEGFDSEHVIRDVHNDIHVQRFPNNT